MDQALWSEVFFAEFPHELTGGEGIDKYTLRKWLVGEAVMKGWSYEPGESRLAYYLKKRGCNVKVEVVPTGLRLTCGDREEVVETVVQHSEHQERT